MAAAGNRNAEQITGAMSLIIRSEPDTKIDYIAAVHPESLEPVSIIRDGVLIALAVFVGDVRLIDNTIIRLKE